MRLRHFTAQATTVAVAAATIGIWPAAGAAYAEGGSCPAFTAVSGGGYHSLALAAGGTVWSWGSNAFGQLGNGSTTSRNNPGPSQVQNATAISAGAQHSLALAVDGTVTAWGYNNSGQLGNGTNTSTYELPPVKVSGLTGVTAIAAGGYHSLALAADGSVWAWGQNRDGQLGDDSPDNRNTPVKVLNLSGVTAIAAGLYHSMALKNDGTVWTWGYNSFGQLGNDNTTSRDLPVQATGLSNASAIGAGSYHSLAVASGVVHGWGWNSSGQVGDNTVTNRDVPTATTLSGATAVDGGGSHSVAVLTGGAVRVWGGNSYGQLGDASNLGKRTAVSPSWEESGGLVSGGETHTLAAPAGGDGWGWGDSTDGQVGDGTNTARNVPTRVLCAPQLGTVTDGPDPVAVGEVLTFSVGWSAPNPSAQVRAVVCKTNAVSAATCPGGHWSIGALEARHPSETAYVPASADVGTRTYYAFACDATNVCSPSHTGTFTVVMPQCSDGDDNDTDGKADWPHDPSCATPSDTTEAGPSQCADGDDNDGDNVRDYPGEPDCSSEVDSNEGSGVDAPQPTDELWSQCLVRELGGGYVALVAAAYAFGATPAQTTSVDCTATAGGAELRAAGSSVGPAVTTVSSRLMPSGTFVLCWSSSALWADIAEVSVGTRQTQPRTCRT
jgi:alpha-tubulin suppressor-like RCC1 family protein